MFHLRPYIVAILFSCSLSALSQSHDFEVRDFHENVTDLKAASSDVRDINGVVTALIRFAIRDTLFSFEANNGILRRINEVGEILLYVPTTTKRITIKHPNLGILRDYQLPIAVKSKTTYDAEIVITNADYLRRLYGYEQQPVVSIEEPIVDMPEQTFQNELPILNASDSIVKHRTPIKTYFFFGGGCQAMGVVGPTAQIGLEIGSFHLSADYTIGTEKVEGVGIYYRVKGTSDNSLGEVYDYSVSRITARLGLNTSPNSVFQVIPQIGASFTMIKGDEVKKSGSLDQFSKSTPVSLSAAISFRVRLIAPLCLYVTPQYDFSVVPDDAYKVIKDADKKIKGWGEGFCVSAGLLLRF